VHGVILGPRAFAEFEVIPDASDLKEQRESQAFRKAVRDNSRLHARVPAEVDWTAFQSVRNHLLSGVETVEAAEAKARKMIDFVLHFMQSTNKRLNLREDLALLETCSIFDPAHRTLNKPQRKQYMDRLLEAFPHDDPNTIHTESVAWLSSNVYDTEAGIVKHFAALCRGKDKGLVVFARWVFDVLKNLPSNAIVEGRFSTAAQVKRARR
jgi:hypothetical protein